MAVPFSAFVFCTQSHYGVSVLSNGSNLPRLTDNEEWRPMQIKITTLRDLNDYTDDLTSARFDLLSRGYHFCKMKMAQSSK
jgi:hypothetical protein